MLKAVLPVTCVFVRRNVPEEPIPPPVVARLPATVQSVKCRLPDKTRAPPPGPLVAPFVMRSPRRDTTAFVSRSTARPRLPPSRMVLVAGLSPAPTPTSVAEGSGRFTR